MIAITSCWAKVNKSLKKKTGNYQMRNLPFPAKKNLEVGFVGVTPRAASSLAKDSFKAN